MIYIGDLYAIYSNGTLKWQYPQKYTSVYQDGCCYGVDDPSIGGDGTVYATFWNVWAAPPYNFYLKAIYPNGTLKWRYQTNTKEWFCSPPSIGNDGTVYIGAGNSSAGHLYAISTKVFSNTSSWSTFGENSEYTRRSQLQSFPLQLFDLRYLTLIGVPSITGQLKLETDPIQASPFYLDITLNILQPQPSSSPQPSHGSYASHRVSSPWLANGCVALLWCCAYLAGGVKKSASSSGMTREESVTCTDLHENIGVRRSGPLL